MEQEAEHREGYRHEAVDGGHQDRAAHPADEPAIKRHDGDGANRCHDPEISDAVTAEDRRDRLAQRAHGKIAAEHAEEERDGREDGGRLAWLDTRKAREEACQRRPISGDAGLHRLSARRWSCGARHVLTPLPRA